MSQWKFTDSTRSVVMRTLEDGRVESMVSAEILDGVEVLPEDPAQPVSPAAQIDALERLHMLPRPVRDVMLGLMEKEAAALGITPTQLRVVNPGYRRVKELDEQIAALRAAL